MDYAYLYVTAGILLVLGLVILVFAGLVAINRHYIKTGEHSAVQTFVAEAIILAYKASDAVFDATEQRLHSVQKREVAAAVYDLLPDEISITFLSIKIAWKRIVSRERFMDFVAAQYDILVEKFHAVKESVLDEMVQELPAKV